MNHKRKSKETIKKENQFYIPFVLSFGVWRARARVTAHAPIDKRISTLNSILGFCARVRFTEKCTISFCLLRAPKMRVENFCEISDGEWVCVEMAGSIASNLTWKKQMVQRKRNWRNHSKLRHAAIVNALRAQRRIHVDI